MTGNPSPTYQNGKRNALPSLLGLVSVCVQYPFCDLLICITILHRPSPIDMGIYITIYNHPNTNNPPLYEDRPSRSSFSRSSTKEPRRCLSDLPIIALQLITLGFPCPSVRVYSKVISKIAPPRPEQAML